LRKYHKMFPKKKVYKMPTFKTPPRKLLPSEKPKIAPTVPLKKKAVFSLISKQILGVRAPPTPSGGLKVK
jgi:hypothetical protein